MSKTEAKPKPKKATPVHPSVTYIQQFPVGRVICKGLSVVAKLRPDNPVEYLAKWLLSFQHQSDVQKQMNDKERKGEEAKKRHKERLQKLDEERKRKEEDELKAKNKTLEFEKTMGNTEDLVDLFDDFAEYLKETTGATGVYIGRLEQTKKEIKEGDNDAAHVDEAGIQVVKYISASKDHSFMVGKSLKTTEGVTPDVFIVPEAVPPPAPPAQPPVAEEVALKKDQPEDLPIAPIVYRPEVTREPRLKFFKVPRLGCYLAVPLVYSSCLTTEALDAAVADYSAYRETKKRNEALTKEYEDKVAQAKAEAEAEAEEKEEGEGKDKSRSRIAVDKSLNKSKDKSIKKVEEEPPTEAKTLEPPKLEEVKEPEYKVKPISYVVCLDTMGQDREFSEEQKKAVMAMVKKYKLKWEEREKIRLTSDRQLKEAEKEKDTECLDKVVPGLQEEEDKNVEEQMANLAEEPGAEEKKEKDRLMRWGVKVKNVTEGVFKDKVLALSRYNVVKIPRIMQTLFYLLGYKREDICEPGTNKLFWKKAHKLWDADLLSKFQSYTPVGPKEGDYKKYQKINFLEKNLEGITEEEVRGYSLGLEKLFSCILHTLELRKEDIMRRKEKREKLQKEREETIQKSEQRTKERAEDLRVKKEEELNAWTAEQEKKAAEKQKAAEEKKEESAPGSMVASGKPSTTEAEEVFKFDEEEFLREWDAKNPAIEVPPEVKEEKDDDYEFEAVAAQI